MQEPVVHFIDDDDSLRTAVSRLLGASGYTVRQYASAEAFLQEENLAGGCILLDIGMPGLSGVQLQEHLNARNCILPIIFMTGSGDIATSVRTIKAGAEDFLCKPVDPEQLRAAIERSFARYRSTASERSTLAALEARLALLSPRERQVFDLVITGLLNKQIADRLGTTERTVKAHRAAIMEKMQMRSVAELVTAASELRLLAG